MGIVAALAQHGYDVLTYDLRGYGESEGDHFSLGQFEQRDLRGALSFVKKRGYLPEHIGALGLSMGAATTIMVAGDTSDIRAVWSDSAYASLPDELQEIFTAYSHLPNWFLPGTLAAGRVQLGFDPATVKPEEAIAKFGVRHIYLIHGLRDTLVYPTHVDRLAKAGGTAVAAVWKLPDVGHTQAFDKHTTEYSTRMVAFFDTELQ